MNAVQMKIDPKVKEVLDKLKVHHKQSYSEIIEELVKFYINEMEQLNAMEQRVYG